MSEPIKEYRFMGTDEVYHDANLGQLYYLKSDADAVLEEKNKEIEGWKAGYNNLINVDIPRIEANLKKEIEKLKHEDGYVQKLENTLSYLQNEVSRLSDEKMHLNNLLSKQQHNKEATI